MTQKSVILGIETSCDETAVALVEMAPPHHPGDAPTGYILAHHVASHIEPDVYGGVVPELAARAHIEKLQPLVTHTFHQAQRTPDTVDAIAVTCGPGLIGGVVVGAMYAKGLAASLNKPFIPVNHLEGHALTVRMTDRIPFPYILLLASGGHCQFLYVKNLGDYHLLGQTLDDAAGEAFDKVAKMLDLPYPGGPHIEKRARQGSDHAYDFPRPLLSQASCDFSFSGLKTAVLHTLQKHIRTHGHICDHTKNNICASFQKAVIDCMTNRMEHAIRHVQKTQTDQPRHIVIAGGVAANRAILKSLQNVADRYNLTAVAPPVSLCTDNAAMIAWAGGEHFLYAKAQSAHTNKPIFQNTLMCALRPRWPLDQLKHDMQDYYYG